jgi:hypothetical protein
MQAAGWEERCFACLVVWPFRIMRVMSEELRPTGVQDTCRQKDKLAEIFLINSRGKQQMKLARPFIDAKQIDRTGCFS